MTIRDLVIPDSWPSTSYMAGVNVWYDDADRFVSLITNFTGRLWPHIRHDLKYVNLRIDSRNNSFILLLDDNKTRVPVEEVLQSMRDYVNRKKPR